jgi:uncharacterized protein
MASERYVTLDVIRGIAVMGILSVNIVNFSSHTAFYLNPAAGGWPDPASLAVWAANMVLVDGKFRTLFSMLFGASMLLVVDRVQASGRPGWPVHARRMAVLMAFGAAHAFLIWRGDILLLYGATGLIAYWFRNLASHKLIALAIVLTLVNVLLFGAIGATLFYQEAAVTVPGADPALVRDWNANFHSFYPTAAQFAADRATYHAGWVAIVAHEIGNAPVILMNTLLLLPDTLGLMLFGMAAYRSGFLTGAWDACLYRRVAAWGIGLGLVGFGALVAADIASRFSVPVLLTGFMTASAPFRIVMAFGYAALFILLSRPMGPIARRLAAVGRAAFTNYLGTSLVLTPIFYGWGMGLYGTLTRFEAWLFVPMVWAAMLLWSKPWLSRFRYGPFEWLWRSLARGRPQPMRKG